MKVAKISISLDPDVATEVREAARKSGKSLSAWVAEAVQAQMRAEGLREFLDEWQAEDGPVTAEERALTEAELGAPSSKRRAS